MEKLDVPGPGDRELQLPDPRVRRPNPIRVAPGLPLLGPLVRLDVHAGVLLRLDQTIQAQPHSLRQQVLVARELRLRPVCPCRTFLHASHGVLFSL